MTPTTPPHRCLAAALPLVLVVLILAACAEDAATGVPVHPGVPTGPCDTEGEVQACYPGDLDTRAVGACEDGVVLCVEGTWSDCEGYVLPEEETCGDGLDNDCDGVVDQGCSCEEGDTQECYGGSPTTVGIGECQAGTQPCVDGVWDNSCEGEVLPSDDVCDDGIDQDCNGVADDGCGACGDDDCGDGETCTSCPDDCGECPPTCGDTECNGNETCETCPGDCGECPGCPWGSTGEHGDPCPNVPSQTWRCVYIPSWQTNGSQVCRVDTLCPTSQPCWVTYHLNPQDCENCCNAYSAACE